MINPNDIIKVKLTEDGLKILREKFELAKAFGYLHIPFKFEDLYKIDADNYWTTSLWEFIYEIGRDYNPYCNGMPFESIEKVFIQPQQEVSQ